MQNTEKDDGCQGELTGLKFITIIFIPIIKFITMICTRTIVGYLNSTCKTTGLYDEWRQPTHIPLKMAARCLPKIWEQFLFSFKTRRIERQFFYRILTTLKSKLPVPVSFQLRFQCCCFFNFKFQHTQKYCCIDCHSLGTTIKNYADLVWVHSAYPVSSLSLLSGPYSLFLGLL